MWLNEGTWTWEWSWESSLPLQRELNLDFMTVKAKNPSVELGQPN